MFKNKTLLITGGTGSFGNTVLKKFINSELSKIIVFSRDEKKQDDMRAFYNNPKIDFIIGDVRDFKSIDDAMHSVNFVYHAAALKQVPSCEFHPIEAVKTNILGTENVINACVKNNVSKLVCLSTDKAVYPINAMGMSKALMEKVMVAKSRSLPTNNLTICGTRYGNVMASRGSVIPLFINQIKNNEPICITDPNMTRFMMTLDDALDLVMYAFSNGQNGDIFVQKAPSATVETLAKALVKIFDVKDHPIKIIGTRHGEKLYESLLSREERALAIEEDNYFRVPADHRDLNYSKYIDQGNDKVSEFEDYNSHNTEILDVDSLIPLLKKLKVIKENI